MPAELIGHGRPMRTCIGCLQTDDHPRCIVDTGTGEDVTWHHDCHHAAIGPADCHRAVELAAGGTGEDMLAAILSHAAGAVSGIDQDEAARVGLVEQPAAAGEEG